MYQQNRYNLLVEKVVKELKQLSDLKGGEYARSNDRLANFRKLGEDCGLDMLIIWRVYAGKHWDAISTYVRDVQTGDSRTRLESISGRATDLIVYLILFLAILDERKLLPDALAPQPSND